MTTDLQSLLERVEQMARNDEESAKDYNPFGGSRDHAERYEYAAERLRDVAALLKSAIKEDSAQQKDLA